MEELINVAQFIRSTPKEDIWHEHNTTGLPTEQILFFLKNRTESTKDLKIEIKEIESQIYELESSKRDIERKIKYEKTRC
jgi:hypothetical protein